MIKHNYRSDSPVNILPAFTNVCETGIAQLFNANVFNAIFNDMLCAYKK